jgi:hypothetical protein
MGSHYWRLLFKHGWCCALPAEYFNNNYAVFDVSGDREIHTMYFFIHLLIYLTTLLVAQTTQCCVMVNSVLERREEKTVKHSRY